MHTKFWSENLNGRGHLEDVGVDEEMILEWTLWKLEGKVCVCVDWFHLAQIRD